MDCFQTFPGCDTAVCLKRYARGFGEYSIPKVNTADFVLAKCVQARARFPGAEVVSGGLDDIMDTLSQPAVKAALPTLMGEIGDTWNYGI